MPLLSKNLKILTPSGKKEKMLMFLDLTSFAIT